MTTTTTTTTTASSRAGTVLRHTMKKERPAPVARTAPHRNAAGHDLGTVDLEPTVFGLTPNRAVLHQVVTAQLAGIRAGTQSTRTRAKVRGGGAKPFRQKGTGRARQGSSRSPSMSGGGVALGPKPRSYDQHTPKKMVRLALLSALSDRAEIGRILVVDDWKITGPSTKDAATIVRRLKLGTDSVLIVLAQDEIDMALSFRNLPQASTTTFAELSAHDVLRADWLLFSDRTLPTSPGDFSGTHVMEPVSGATTRTAASPAGAEADETDEAEAEAGGEDVEASAPAKAANGHHGHHGGEGRQGDEVDQGSGDHGHQDGEVGQGGGHEGDQGHRGRRHRRGRQRGDRVRCVTPCRCSSAPLSRKRATRSMDQRVYVFIVDPKATKIEVRHAVEQAFGVRVTKVNTLNRKGKATRNRRTNVRGKRPDTKRAIVTLHPDDSIDLFER